MTDHPSIPDPDDPIAPAAGRWLLELLSDSRAVVSRLLCEPLVPVDDLRTQVEAYRLEIQQRTQADGKLGAALAERSLRLLDTMDGCSEHHRRLGQVAVRYFVMDDDGDDDLMSPFGFDDDVEVFNAVVGELGLEDLLIADD